MVIVSFSDSDAIDEYFLKLAKGKTDYEESVLGAQEEIASFRTQSISSSASANKYMSNLVNVDILFKYVSGEYGDIIKAELQAEDLVIEEVTEEEEAKQEATEDSSDESGESSESSGGSSTKEIEGLPLIKQKMQEYVTKRKEIINATIDEHKKNMEKQAKEASKYMGTNLNPIKVGRSCGSIVDSNTLTMICEGLLKEYKEKIDTLIL